MAGPAAVFAAKAAVMVATDKRLRKIALWVIMIALCLLIMPIIIILGAFQVGSQLDFNTLGITGSMTANLSPELRAQVDHINSVMDSLKSAAGENAPGADFLLIQIVYLCAFYGAEGQSSTFYDDFTGCFAEGDAFANLAEVFGWSLSAQDVSDIMSLYAKAASSSQLPPTSIHGTVGDLTAEYGGSLSAGGFSSPLGARDYKSLISSGYGSRDDPFTGEKNTPHTGIDIAVPAGTDVYPVMEGKVILSVTGNSGYGNYVVVAHGGGYASLYGHLSQILVQPGNMVTRDMVIAKSGNSGKSTGPHLHLEIIIDGQPVDPMRYLP
ncbi:MAG: M23 family metallopeptidase [Clostridiales Family XIII bacterium]|nr:M23 family metallopeptidase [Clostridiales Family XIII bacterium]